MMTIDGRTFRVLAHLLLADQKFIEGLADAWDTLCIIAPIYSDQYASTSDRFLVAVRNEPFKASELIKL